MNTVISLTPPPEGSGTEDPKRQQSRSRPVKSLMTERLKQEGSEEILLTTGSLSGPTKRPVSGQQLSDVLSIHEATARLPLPFFKAAGWLEKSGRAEYTTTDALLEYQRNRSLGATHDEAVGPLTEAMRGSWMWQETEPLLGLGSVRLASVKATLMRASGASPSHATQIENTIAWMAWARLIEVEGEQVNALGPVRTIAPPADPEGGGDASEGEGATTKEGGEAAQVEPKRTVGMPEPKTFFGGGDIKGSGSGTGFVLSVNYSWTADDLANFSPEQMAAVGTLLSAVKTLNGG